MNEKEVIEAIRKNRMKKNWSQYRLAKEAGVSREMLAKLEKGAHSPKLDTVLKILDSLSLEVVIVRR